MTVRTRFVFGGVAMVVAAFFLATQVMSQEEEEASAQAPAEQQMAEMMAKWKELNAKGPEHERFKTMVGKWDALSKFWMGPGDPMVSKGTAEFELILDGRYVMQKYHCPGVMGDDKMFEGIGIEGYDRFKKKYVSMWMDNESTGIFMSEGTADESGKVFTYHGKMDDPMTGQKDKDVKSIARVINDDEVVFEMYDTVPGGGEYKSMEITYTRKK